MYANWFEPFSIQKQMIIDTKMRSTTLRNLPLNSNEWDVNSPIDQLLKQLEGVGVQANSLKEIRMTRSEVIKLPEVEENFYLFIDTNKIAKFTFEAYEKNESNTYTETHYFKTPQLLWLNTLGVMHLMNDKSDSLRIFVTEGPVKVTREIQQYFCPDLSKERVMEIVWERARRGLLMTDELLQIWDLHGLHATDLPPHCHFYAIKYDEVMVDHFRYLQQMTLASLFPIPCTVISMSDIDAVIEHHRGTKDFCIFLSEGTYISNLHGFLYETYKQCEQLKREHRPLACHIMDFRGEGKIDRAPYIHEQFFILSMDAFSELPRSPGFFKYGHTDVFPSYRASVEQIHDNYTPVYLDPISNYGQDMKYEWGSEMLKLILQEGFRVVNVSSGVRECKRFAYPAEPDNFDQEQKIISLKNFRSIISDNRVFTFNVFDYAKDEILTIQHNEIISLASGFVPLLLYKNNYHSLDKFFFYDKNFTSLQYWYDLIYAKCTYKQLSKRIFEMAKQIFAEETEVFIDMKIRNLIKVHFADNELEFLTTLASMRERAEFHKMDIAESPSGLSTLGKRESKKIVWISNIFSTHLLHQMYTKSEVECRRVNFMKSFIQSGENIFVTSERERFCIGQDIKNYRILVTDDNLQFHPESFKKWHPPQDVRSYFTQIFV